MGSWAQRGARFDTAQCFDLAIFVVAVIDGGYSGDLALAADRGIDDFLPAFYRKLCLALCTYCPVPFTTMDDLRAEKIIGDVIAVTNLKEDESWIYQECQLPNCAYSMTR